MSVLIIIVLSVVLIMFVKYILEENQNLKHFNSILKNDLEVNKERLNRAEQRALVHFTKLVKVETLLEDEDEIKDILLSEKLAQKIKEILQTTTNHNNISE